MAPACVYVSSLSYEATEAHIREAFAREKIGTVRVELLLKGAPSRQHHSGLAVVHVASAADAVRSCELLDGKSVLGRPMLVRQDRFAADHATTGSEGSEG